VQQLLNILPLLACPLMMMLCMRGMFGGQKSCHKDGEQNNLLQKLEALEKQNLELRNELNQMKNQKMSDKN
jgi:Protein of unknown function (DUF2933)